MGSAESEKTKTRLHLAAAILGDIAEESVSLLADRIKTPLWLYVPALLVMACGLALLGGCTATRPHQQCLYPRTPTPAQQAGAAAEMQAHPKLPNIRIQMHDLDDALRQNATRWEAHK